MCVGIYPSQHTPMYSHIHQYIHTCIHTGGQLSRLLSDTHLYIHAYKHIYRHTGGPLSSRLSDTHLYIHAYRHTYMYIHAYRRSTQQITTSADTDSAFPRKNRALRHFPEECMRANLSFWSQTRILHREYMRLCVCVCVYIYIYA
jgi:hypothetical protein